MKFYVWKRNEIEPLEESEIISLWKRGTLKDTDLVRTEESGEWTPLAKLLSLPSSNPISPENDEPHSKKEKRPSLTGLFTKAPLRQLAAYPNRQINKLNP